MARPIAGALLAGILGIAAATPLMAESLQLPPIVDPARQQQHPGKVIFVELMTPDLAGAKQFYGQLFGWTFRDYQGRGISYTEAYLDDRAVAGMIRRDIPAGQRRQPAWLTFISSRDVVATTTTAVQNGARVIFEPHRIPKRGQQAVFADPQGAVFAVITSSSGDPPDELAEPGEWIWSSLMTSDPDRGAAFYQTLFDYEVFELPPGEGPLHFILAGDNYARASVNPLPVNDPNSRPHWLNYVRVDNAMTMAARVVALGGRVLVEPRPDRHGGMIAVVADPMGAPFGLLEWNGEGGQ